MSKSDKTITQPIGSLQLALLTMQPDNPSCRAIKEAAKNRGHRITAFSTLDYADKKNGPRPEQFDAVIPRIGPEITEQGMNALRRFETNGVYNFNPGAAISLARNKCQAHLFKLANGLATPHAIYADHLSTPADLYQALGSGPYVLKLTNSTQGYGVYLRKTLSEAWRLLNKLRGNHSDILVEEFIAESRGSDIRCLVLGKKIVAVMQRRAKRGDFRSNVHCGGTASPATISTREQNLAVKAAHLFGLGLAGVDLLRSKRGPLLLEVNASPGLHEIEKISKAGIADLIIRQIESRCIGSQLPQKNQSDL